MDNQNKKPCAYSEKGEPIYLTKEEEDMCSYSPIEVLLYYISYPNQLLKDATEKGINIKDYFIESYNSALIYWYKKYN